MIIQRCAICEETFRQDDDPRAYQGSDERAEMYDPSEDGASVVVHADCGLSRGWEMA